MCYGKLYLALNKVCTLSYSKSKDSKFMLCFKHIYIILCSDTLFENGTLNTVKSLCNFDIRFIHYFSQLGVSTVHQFFGEATICRGMFVCSLPQLSWTGYDGVRFSHSRPRQCSHLAKMQFHWENILFQEGNICPSPKQIEEPMNILIFFSWNKLLRAMVESLSNLTSSWWMRWQIWVCCLTNPSMWWQICVWCVTNPSETHCVSLTSLSTHVQGGLVPQRANSNAPIVSTPPACTSCCTSCCWCSPTCTFPLVTCSPRCIEARNRVAQNFLGISLQRMQAKDQNIANTLKLFTFQLFFPFLSFNFNSIPLFNQLRTSDAKVLKVLSIFWHLLHVNAF